jgi:DNA-binding MarR family transcriptional regulator
LSVERIFESSECMGEESLGYIRETTEEASLLEVGAEEDLTPSQAKIYVTLTSKGPLTFESISKMLKIDLSDVCRAILRLQKRGFVSVGDVLPIIRSLK